MRKMMRGVVAAMLLSCAVARAAPIQFDFTGTVTDDAINGCGGLVACGVVSGSYSFDSLASDGNASTSLGLYGLLDISFFIDGTLFFSGTNGFINVVNGAFADQYGLLALGGSASNGSSADFSLLLQDLTGLAFGSDALPLTAGLLATLLPGGFTLNATDDAFQLAGTFDAITCTSGCGATEVPEPGSLALLALGLVGVGLSRRSSNRDRGTRATLRARRR